MASSGENQGLQIALIIFVMLTILLSVTTFMFFQQYQEADARSVSDQAAVAEATESLRATVAEVSDVKKMIGVPDTAKHPDVQATFAEDMKQFGATIPEDKRYYRQALEFVYTTLASTNEQLVEARTTIQNLKDSNQAFETAKQQQLATAEAAQKQAEDALAAAQASFTDELDKKNQLAADLQGKLAQKDQELAKAAEDSKKLIDDLTKNVEKLELLVDVANTKIKELDPTVPFEVADGEVRWVDQTSASVWINVGQADGLRRGITFSIVGGDQAVGGNQVRKASIEVTDILGPHFARARIVEDALSDPIVQGDKIFTPLWQAGRGEQFAIAGLIDVDGDGVDDRDMIRDLIRMAGGTIDAEVDDKGAQTGEMSLNTRYLIMGKEPADEALDGYTAIQKEAERLGVHQINVAKFLDHVGWKDQRQVLRFGRRGNAEQMTGPAPDGGRPVAPGDVSEIFKKRAPPGKRQSAY
ncbi:MAG: hypothetical protein WD847_02405 [Pirellulales bacterium]